MTPVSRAVFVAVAGLVLQLPSAHAQNAGAEALFREGRTLIKQGKLKEGCDKLEASEKLESSVGTLLNVGNCREKQGKLASAWAAFRKAEAIAKRAGNDKKRQQEARRRALKLEKDLAHVTVQVGPKAKSEGLVIRRDDEIVDPALYGDSIPVDPGAHVIVAEAPGHKPWKHELSVGKGGKRVVVVPTLEKLPAPEPPPPPPAVADSPPPAPAVVIDQPARTARTIVVRETWSTTRQIAVGVGVVGVAALGVGAYFGSRANDLEAQSNDICPTSTCDDPEGLRLNDRAQDNALRANVLLVAGGAAVATATVMWFVGGPDERTVVAPSISETSVGASLTRRF